MGTIPQIALVPPRPRLDLPRNTRKVDTCSSCEGLLNETGECRGCSD